MQNILFLLLLVLLIGISSNYAYSQEMRLATFQETAQVIIDKSISQNVTASITLQSTSIQEIKIPAELEQKIRENNRISAVTLTNQNQCILGVDNMACILINVKRDSADKNFLDIQKSTIKISDQLIDEINQVFDTKAEFHSTFIHTDDKSRVALETSGIISGRGTVSAVYTMPTEDTDSMYEKISAMLIPKTIRDSGGFYDVARDLSKQENSKMTFSIIPIENKSLLQLRLSVDYPQTALRVNEVNPLEFLNVKNLDRSDYFSAGFYPLNSIIQVIVLSPEDTSILNIKGNILPTQIIDNEKIPTDITKEGWIFDPEKGQKIQGKYIFGEKTSVSNEELKFSLDKESTQNTTPEEIKFDESVAIVIIITIVAIAAAVFYLKGYKK
ncbi:MAG: hypothetical protein OEL81_08335 [Nitrosopumilus sp.]|nr:hypothetical protein [Nitrosopumilus sp.]